MVRKVQDSENNENTENSSQRAASKRPGAGPGTQASTQASTRTRRPAAKAAPAAQPPAPPPTASGAKALIQAGLKALGDVRGDMAARQARVFELLLGVGQSPAWSSNSGERTRSLADPFGKFEEVFDERVARSLERIGIPSPQVLQALVEQVKLLAESSAEASKAAAPAPSKPRRR